MRTSTKPLRYVKKGFTTEAALCSKAFAMQKLKFSRASWPYSEAMKMMSGLQRYLGQSLFMAATSMNLEEPNRMNINMEVTMIKPNICSVNIKIRSLWLAAFRFERLLECTEIKILSYPISVGGEGL